MRNSTINGNPLLSKIKMFKKLKNTKIDNEDDENFEIRTSESNNCLDNSNIVKNILN